MARLRFALRSLSKSPLLCLVVVLSLGLGVGANTAIFSLLHQVVLSSLPVAHPEELAVLHSPGDVKNGRGSTNNAGDMDSVFNYHTLRELEKRPQGVAGIAGFRQIGANLAYGRQTVPGDLMLVSGEYFPLLGVQPLLGRILASDDDMDGAGNPVAVLGYGYWRDRLGGETSVLNQSIRVNAQVFTIVGVTPQGFNGLTYGDQPDIYVPISFKPKLTPGWNGTDKQSDYWVYLFARLRPGLSRQRAAAALNSTYVPLVEQQAQTEKFRTSKDKERFLQSRLTLADGRQGQSSMRDGQRVPILILMAATVLVLLIAVANAANLLLARSAQRRKELAIRAAMGASRAELVGQMLAEALLLALGGAATGVLIGGVTLQLLIRLSSNREMAIQYLTAHLEWPVLLFSVALSLAAGILFGLYPAWEGARASLGLTLKDEAGQASATRATARLRRVLVCAQVMISAMLLIPTGLFLTSLVNLLHVNLGMRTENVIGFSISPQLNGYTPERIRSLYERAEAELAAIPGVRGVAASMVPLIAGSNWGTSVKIEGSSTPNTNSLYNKVGPGFFGKMEIPLIAGREFTLGDNAAGSRVAVVNQQFVRHFLAGRNPIGVHFSTGGGDPSIEIVGVVQNSHYSGVKQEVPDLFFTPWRQDQGIGSLSFYVRSALPAGQMIPQIRRTVASLDPDLPPERLRTLDDQISRNIRSDRVVLQLAAAFAFLATALAMLGLYGVMAHSVTRRTREIGIRMALGAAPRRIRAMVLREILWILGIGLAAGVPAALLLSRLTQSQLFGVKAYDGMVLAGAILALTASAVAAGFLPARRAARVNPLDALRYE